MTYEQLLREAEQEEEDTLKTKKWSNQLAIVLYTSGSTGVPKGNITFVLIMYTIRYTKKDLHISSIIISRKTKMRIYMIVFPS